MDKVEKDSSSASKEKQPEVDLETSWTSEEDYDATSPERDPGHKYMEFNFHVGRIVTEAEKESQPEFPAADPVAKKSTAKEEEPGPEQKGWERLCQQIDYNIEVLRVEAEERAKKNQQRETLKASEPEADFITNWPSEEYFDMLKEEEGPKRPRVDHSERWSSDEEYYAEDKELTQLWMEFEHNRELLMRETEEEEARKRREGIVDPKTCCWDEEAIQDDILGSICRHCGKSM